MSKIFFLGFFWLSASTIAFIVAILTPYWIIKTNPRIRGIFEVCELVNNDNEIRGCSYILTYSSNPFVLANRTGKFKSKLNLIFIFINLLMIPI